MRRRPLLRLASLFVVAAAGASAFGAPGAALALPGIDPNAAFTASPNPASLHETVTFDASGSSGDGLGGTITNYEWDLDGNGLYETDTDATPTTSRAYSSPGTIQVRLRVTDNEGDSDEAVVSLKINAPPSAGFIFEPSTPAVGEQVTFSSTASDPDGSLSSSANKWDLDNDGAFDDATGQTVTHTFGSAGTFTVRLEVTDADGDAAVAARDVLVQDDPPDATFDFSPATPLSNETVTFDASASSPSAGQTITAISWDLDGDGEFDEATGPTATYSYPTPGPRTVYLRVDDDGAGHDITSRVVPVGNRAPKALLGFAPEKPRAGDTLRLFSTASDPDGPIVTQRWDLNGDGSYDDATGETAEKRLNNAGEITVGLRVTDPDGASDTVTRKIQVGERQLELLTPFPVVRLVGELKANGKTEIKRLSVRAPHGADITVRCDGKSCPFERRERAVKRNRVRFPGVERVFEPRAVLEVFVTDPNKIGKYTRFRVRDDKAPERNDSCVSGEKKNPIPCPQT